MPMIVTVDPLRCIGCGLCTVICPELFSLQPRMIAAVIRQSETAAEQACLQDAVMACPENALLLVQD